MSNSNETGDETTEEKDLFQVPSEHGILTTRP